MSYSRFFHGVIALVAKGMGTGLIPKAPGTWGSVLGLFIAYSVSIEYPHLVPQLAHALWFSLVSLWVIHVYERNSGKHDDQQVTLDEVAGIIITFIGIPMVLPNILAGFFLFRFFDILKPFPIGWCDKNLPGAFGTLVDDLLAGAISCIILHFIVYLT